jgi:glycosyltransferase involved in cell wall biosynthesis
VALGDWHPRKAAAALCYFGEAVVAGDWFVRHDVRHVHAHFSSTVGLLIADLFPISLSITLHGPDEFESPATFRLADKLAGSRFVVAISHYASSQIMRYSPQSLWGRIDVVPLGVDTSLLSLRGPSPPSGAFRVLCAGRLAPVKGHHILLDAIAILKTRHPEVVVHIAGDGPERAALEAHARQLRLEGQVVFEGLLDQMQLAALYAAADVFALPTFAEGVPVVLMEAMAVGVPCVSTWVAGVPELITHEQSGLLVPPGDHDAFASAIEHLIADPALRRRLALAGREAVVAKYDIETNVTRLADVFERRLRPRTDADEKQAAHATRTIAFESGEYRQERPALADRATPPTHVR